MLQVAHLSADMEGLSVVKADLSAFLHPSRTGDVQQGLLQLLSSLLLRYNEEFDGVVLAYYDLKICNWTAKILSGLSPYLCMKIKAKLLLFSPKPGMLLEGKVNKVEKDYIGVIVLGFFNAAIAFADIREEFSYQDNVDGIPMWASTSSVEHVIRLGSMIKFSVKRKKHKRRRSKERKKEKLDAMIKDGDIPSKEFLADNHQKREHKHRSKRKRNDTDTDT